LKQRDFIAKYSKGISKSLILDMKKHYKEVFLFKPKGSRSESFEILLFVGIKKPGLKPVFCCNKLISCRTFWWFRIYTLWWLWCAAGECGGVPARIHCLSVSSLD